MAADSQIGGGLTLALTDARLGRVGVVFVRGMSSKGMGGRGSSRSINLMFAPCESAAATLCYHMPWIGERRCHCSSARAGVEGTFICVQSSGDLELVLKRRREGMGKKTAAGHGCKVRGCLDYLSFCA